MLPVMSEVQELDVVDTGSSRNTRGEKIAFMTLRLSRMAMGAWWRRSFRTVEDDESKMCAAALKSCCSMERFSSTAAGSRDALVGSSVAYLDHQ